MIPVSALGVDPVLSVSFGTKAIRALGTASKSSKEASHQTFGFDGIRGRLYGARLAREDRPLPHSRAPGSVPWAGPPPTSGRLPEYRLCRCGSTSTLHVRQGPDESAGFNRAPGALQCRPACRGGHDHLPWPRRTSRTLRASASDHSWRTPFPPVGCLVSHRVTTPAALPTSHRPSCSRFCWPPGVKRPFLSSSKGAGSAHEGAY